MIDKDLTSNELLEWIKQAPDEPVMDFQFEIEAIVKERDELRVALEAYKEANARLLEEDAKQTHALETEMRYSANLRVEVERLKAQLEHEKGIRISYGFEE